MTPLVTVWRIWSYHCGEYILPDLSWSARLDFCLVEFVFSRLLEVSLLEWRGTAFVAGDTGKRYQNKAMSLHMLVRWLPFLPERMQRFRS